MDIAAETLQDLPKDFHYVFDVVHFILCIQGDRADMGDNFSPMSRLHPLSTWFSAMMSCFAGGLLVNPLCGEPILAALNDTTKVLIATLLWFLLYYCPKDLAHTATKLFPVRLAMYIVKGLYYPKKIVAGMKHAGHVLKGNLLAVFLLAVCKGNGSGVIKPLARLARGSWTPLAWESVVPSVTTKYCLLATSAIYLFPTDITYVAVTGLFLAMKVGPLLGVPVDMFTPVENKLAPMILGVPEEKEKKTK